VDHCCNLFSVASLPWRLTENALLLISLLSFQGLPNPPEAESGTDLPSAMWPVSPKYFWGNSWTGEGLEDVVLLWIDERSIALIEDTDHLFNQAKCPQELQRLFLGIQKEKR